MACLILLRCQWKKTMKKTALVFSMMLLRGVYCYYRLLAVIRVRCFRFLRSYVTNIYSLLNEMKPGPEPVKKRKLQEVKESEGVPGSLEKKRKLEKPETRYDHQPVAKATPVPSKRIGRKNKECVQDTTAKANPKKKQSPKDQTKKKRQAIPSGAGQTEVNLYLFQLLIITSGSRRGRK